ncbi:DsbA family protein [Patescibacteria group bacterium]|nr:DsbA family protein [Patescibacteria group bacterium]
MGISIVLSGLIIAGAIVYAVSVISQGGTGGIAGGEVVRKGDPEVTQDSHIRGEFSAPVTIVEFSDFQCPFCRRFHPTLVQILEEYPSQVRWVYKHFPIDSIHNQARPSAEASECAAEQDKFWEFTDALFENQPRLSADLYPKIAENLGLDIARFQSCVDSRKYKDKVEADYQEGLKIGVRGTPGSFVNGEFISGAISYGTLKSLVDAILSDL